MRIGFSTSCLYGSPERISRTTFAMMRAMGAECLELFWLDLEGEVAISNLEKKDLSLFSYLALHLPSLETYSEAQLVNMLDLVKLAHEKLEFRAIVVHPHAAINWEIFNGYDLPFMIENMDWRKEVGKYVESLQDIFSKFDVPMVLDVNHCLTNDPSLHLVADMFEAFGSRIKEIHLSGFEASHEPLFETGQDELMQAIVGKDLPVIIESRCASLADLEKEFVYVQKILG